MNAPFAASERDVRPVGTVWLVGAGPGDPDLLTMKAARLIGSASLLVHDGLVSDAILDLAPADAERISVAKQRNRHSLPQDDINALLVARALTGQDVVRLKGGDPFVFGRGGEELEACRKAGVPVQVVPGISAALGCAAAANLPLTHRNIASSVSFVAGQCQGLSEQNWAGLAGKDRTLVVYMGVGTAGDIADKLIGEGLSPDTPVVILENGTLPEQRALRTLLVDLGPLVEREQVRSPAIIVVGQVAGLADAADRLGQRTAGLESWLVGTEGETE
jgi:uroporphyrin-III C-methyltransferase